MFEYKVYQIPMQCRVKRRPRCAGKHAYMDAKYRGYQKEFLGLLYAYNEEIVKIDEGDIEINVLICFEKKGRGDLDNLVGFLKDVGNGIFWTDDKQITKSTQEIVRNSGHNIILVGIRRR